VDFYVENATIPLTNAEASFCLFGARLSGFLKVADRTKEGLSCRAVTRNRAGLELKSKRLCELQMKMTFGWRLVETIVIDRFR